MKEEKLFIEEDIYDWYHPKADIGIVNKKVVIR